MHDPNLRTLIDSGDAAGVRNALAQNASLANEPIRWGERDHLQTDPLHYVSDSVFNGWLTNGQEGNIAQSLLDFRTALNGSPANETPLIGAASLGVVDVANLLVDVIADVIATSVHGANALHWAP